MFIHSIHSFILFILSFYSFFHFIHLFLFYSFILILFIHSYFIHSFIFYSFIHILFINSLIYFIHKFIYSFIIYLCSLGVLPLLEIVDDDQIYRPLLIFIHSFIHLSNSSFHSFSLGVLPLSIHLVWEFYHYRRELMMTKSPNPAHAAIAECQKRWKDQGK